MLNEGKDGSWVSHAKTHCGNSCFNENFQILSTSDLYQLADVANGNYNYITCLFILQIAHSDSSFHYLSCFHEQKQKNKKNIFCIKAKVEFSRELKFTTRKD